MKLTYITFLSAIILLVSLQASYAQVLHPEKISKAILLVPSGICNTSTASIIFNMGIPMILYIMTQNEKWLKRAEAYEYVCMSGQILRRSAGKLVPIV